MASEVKKILRVCRLCLSPQKNTKLKNLNNSRMNYKKDVFELTNLKIEALPSIPALICLSCIKDLDHASKYRRAVIKANELYLQLLSKHQNYIVDPLIVIKNEPELEIKDDSKIFVDDLARIKDEPPDESLMAELTQNDESVQLEVKSEAYAEINEVLDEFSESDDNFLYPVPSPKPIFYEKPPQAATVVSKKSRKEPYQLFVCPTCGIQVCSELERQEHMMTVHEPRKKKRKKRAKLKPSPAAIDGKNEWMCTYCSKCFETKFDMLLHRKREHQKEESTQTCPHCNKYFRKMHLLRSHIVFMHAEKRYQCPTCGERFSSKSFFNLHMLKENNEKNFVCDICSSRFFTTSHLKMHMKRHSEDKPFLCEVNGCGMRFKGKNIIKKHIHVVHLKEKPYTCGVCSRSFSIKHHLKGHLEKVHLMANNPT